MLLQRRTHTLSVVADLFYESAERRVVRAVYKSNSGVRAQVLFPFLFALLADVTTTTTSSLLLFYFFRLQAILTGNKRECQL